MPDTDGERLVQATLVFLTENGVTVCSDDRTVGQPLANFSMVAHSAIAAPGPLPWFEPVPLRPGTALSDKVLHISQPTNSTPTLAKAIQDRLNTAANAATTSKHADRAIGFDSWNVPGVHAHWRLNNWISPDCTPNYRISNPVVAGDLGFISVAADHWGTTYAFQRSETGWHAFGQWNNWMY